MQTDTPETVPATDETEPPVSDDTEEVVILDDAQRKALLGKLAEFELAVTALPPRKQEFVLAYLVDPTNATAAARKAGYTGTSVGVRASKLLNEPKIAAAIALGQNVREDRTFITSERTLHELAVIAFSDIRNYSIGPRGRLELGEGVPEYASRAVSSIEWDEEAWEDDEGKLHSRTKTKIRLWPKTEALRMLAMYQKLLSGEGGVNLTVNDNRGQTHTHNYQANVWQWGERKIKF